MAKTAVIGYGTVGSGVIETINTNMANIDLHSGEEIRVKYVLDIRDFPGDPVQELIIHDFDTILNDEEISVVAEVMGGIEPALTFTKSCLSAGKSVVTSNKELVAEHGAELIKLAKENGANYLFEASVGGGIPIIRPLNQSLVAEDIYEIKGILNGTTNFILTKMKKDGLSFSDALKMAQDNGYAERKPDADVMGFDACRKIAILSSLAYCGQVDFEDIHTEGITEITFNDIKFAEKIGGVIKLIAKSKKENGRYSASVSPAILLGESPLSGVDGVFNAILVRGNMLGDAMFYGKGAGKLPTASAVVADIVDCVKHKGKTITQLWSEDKITLLDNSEQQEDFLIRFKLDDFNSNIEQINHSFASYEAIETSGTDGIENEKGIIAKDVKIADLNDFRQRFPIVLNAIRIEKG